MYGEDMEGVGGGKTIIRIHYMGKNDLKKS